MSSTERTPEDGPVALVTGARGGMGSAVAAALQAAGHRALGMDRDDADLTDPEQAANAVSAVVERFGRLGLAGATHAYAASTGSVLTVDGGWTAR